MPDSFKSDAEWEMDLKDFFELLKSGTAASYIERMAELKARKGDVYASAIEAEAMVIFMGKEQNERSGVAVTPSKREAVPNADDLVDRSSRRVFERMKENTIGNKNKNWQDANMIEKLYGVKIPDNFTSDPEWEADVNTFYQKNMWAHNNLKGLPVDDFLVTVALESYHEFKAALVARKGTAYECMAAWVGGGRASMQIEQEEIAEKRWNAFCKKLVDGMAGPLSELLEPKLENIYLRINQDVANIVNATVYQNRIIQEESFEKSLDKYFENNRQYMNAALDKASDRIIRGASGPIPPRQSHESSLDFYSRLFVYSKNGVQVLPRAEDENALRYYVRLYAQANSRTPIAPRTDDENFFNYLNRLLASK